MVQVCVKVDQDVVDELDSRARLGGLRRSDVVRQALLAYVRSQPAEAELTLGERFGRFAGIVHSGIPDLGTRHEEHLAEWARDGR